MKTARQSTQKGSIELLLVLCCLVGVVIFFSFTLGIAGLIHDHPDFSGLPDLKEIQKNLALLQQEEDKKNDELKSLSSRIKRHQEKLELSNDKFRSDLRSRDSEELQKEISSLTEELEKLSDQTTKTGKPDSNLVSAGELEKNIKELEKIKIKTSELDRKIFDTNLKLSRSHGSKDSSEILENERNTMERELADLKEQVKELTQKLKTAEIENLWGGSGNFEKPLFVECVKGGIIFYPGGERVPIDKLNRTGLFNRKAGTYDAIVMLVRPDGFNSFNKSFWQVVNTNKKVSYEPIDAETSIDSLK